MKTVIFDMYGVILKDPEGGLMPFVNAAFPNLSYEDVYYPHWVEACKGGLSSLDFFARLGFKNDLAAVEKAYLDTIEMDDAFFEVIPRIGERFRLALLSNDLSEWSAYLRGKFGIDRYFDVIIISGDVKVRKPDPRIFEMTLERLGQPASECVYIDDRRKNLQTAGLLGMDTILFNSRNVEYEGRAVRDFFGLADMLMEMDERTTQRMRKGQ